MTLSQTGSRVRAGDDPEVTGFLLADRAWAAYPLGYLQTGAAAQASVRCFEVEGRVTSVLVTVRLSQLTSLLLIGDPAGLGAILTAADDLPASGVFSARVEGLRQLERHARISTAYRMTRMRVDAETLRPRRVAPVARLGAEDLERVKALYGMWTDSQQLPGQLQRGVYYGVAEKGPGSSSQLVAVAGTHCVAPGFGVAAIGNVLTRMDRRNRGLASTTTTAVAQELFRLGCEEVVLNVREGNDAAMAAYRRLGFHPHCAFVEGVFHRG